MDVHMGTENGARSGFSRAAAVGPGERLRARLREAGTVPAVGVYDVFSAAAAAREFEAVFVSGYSFGASHYGLPDEGFIAWTDIVDFVRRLRGIGG